MADIADFEYLTDDELTDDEHVAVEATLRFAFDTAAGASNMSATGEGGEPLNMQIAVAALEAPQWIVHFLRPEVDDEYVTTWRSVWATVDVFHDHDWMPGGEELECAECGAGLAVHRDRES